MATMGSGRGRSAEWHTRAAAYWLAVVLGSFGLNLGLLVLLAR